MIINIKIILVIYYIKPVGFGDFLNMNTRLDGLSTYRQFHISTRNRIDPLQSQNNFTVLMKDLQNYQNFDGLVALHNLLIPQVYNVVEGYTRFRFEEQGVGSYNVDIPIGYYDEVTLIAQLKTTMEAAGTLTYTMTINANSILTITGSGNFQLYYSGNTFGQRYLGLTEVPGTYASSFTFSTPIDIVYPKNIIIKTSLVGANVYNSRTKLYERILCVIPVDPTVKGISYINIFSNNERYFPFENNINGIYDFRFEDDDGALVNIFNDFEFTINAYSPSIPLSPKDYHQIFVRTIDRIDSANTTSSDFTIDVRTFPKFNPNDRYMIALEGLSFSNNIYNINENNNKLVFYEEQATVQERIIITVPIGNYSESELAAAIETYMNANTFYGQTYTCTYDPIEIKFIFVATGAGTITFSLSYTDVESIMASLIGLRGDTIYSSTHTPIGTVDIARNIRSLYITCDSIHSDVYDSRVNKHMNILARLNLNNINSETITYVNLFSGLEQFREYNITGGMLHFRFTDVTNNIVNFNNTDFNFSLTVMNRENFE